MLLPFAIPARNAARLLLFAGFLGVMGRTSLRTYEHIFDNLRGGSAGPELRRLREFDPARSRDWKNLPGDFEEVFAPRVEDRDLAIRRYAHFKLTALHVSPRPRVWIGDDGWLFLNHEADAVYHAAGDPRLLDRLGEWAVALPQWRRWLAERGIRLLVVVAPDKQSVYPEFLPPLHRKLRRDRPLDGLIQRWHAADERLEILDLRDDLCAAKGDQPLYYRTDTHWNPDGATVGYRTAARALGFDPLPDAAFEPDPPANRVGDITLQLGDWPYGPEAFTGRHLREPRVQEVLVPDLDDGASRLDYLKAHCWERPGDGPRAVLFHDSFGDGFFAGLLAEHFGRLLAVPSNHLDPVVIERERPDVVVFEIVERLLQGISPRRPGDPPRRSLPR